MTPSQLLGFARPASTPRSAAITMLDFSAFRQQLESECTHGSAIAPELFQAAIALVSDTETFAGGDVAYPIHEALNWHVTRFGYQARETLYAALFFNEDGSTWQAKLSQLHAPMPRAKRKNTKRPSATEPEPTYPLCPRDPPTPCGERYGIHVPLDGDFWAWYEQHPEIPAHRDRRR